MADFERAILYLEKHGGVIERAQLSYQLADQAPSDAVLEALFHSQLPSGAWSPFWAPAAASVDATCFRLMRAIQLGLDASHPNVGRAIHFLRGRQGVDGSWTEDAALAHLAPPWAQPGQAEATQYLTANAGFCMAALRCLDLAESAAAFLRQTYDVETHRGFVHTCWLAAGLWAIIGDEDAVHRCLQQLHAQVPQMSASNLAWMLHVFAVAGVGRDAPISQAASERLGSLQRPDGSWPSDDGAADDVRVTAEALTTLIKWEYFDQHPFFN
ncbi:MAG: hypothetical protein K6T83_12970 [Alicyclobacillus sp.]|nr:hypothetical protein [Alicyclobacillus sp.]